MENIGLLPLKVLSGNLIELIQFYFLTWSTYHAAMREAAIPIIFGGGLVWSAIMAFKFPEDKFKGVVGTFVMLVVIGILIAPAKDSSPMFPGGAQGPLPVANGSVWIFRLTGNVYQLFRSGTDSIYYNNLEGEATGGESFRTDQHAILYADAAERMAASLEDSPGFAVVTSYMGMCNEAIRDSYNDGKTLEAARGVGLAGSNLIGVNAEDRSVIQGALSGAKETMSTFGGAIANRWWRPDVATVEAGANQLDRIVSASMVDSMVEEGVEMLENIPAHKDPFTGGTAHGFIIPTKAYFDKKNFGKDTGVPTLDPRTFQGGKYVYGSISNGGSLAPDQAFMFYPKSCKDAYELSNYVMAAMRNSNNEHSEVSDPIIRARDNLTAVARSAELANRASENMMRARGLTPANMDSSTLENTSDNVIGGLVALSAKVGEFMLRYKVPMMVSVSAMLAAVLLVAFPLFAVMTVFLGPQILITFFKLVIFAFLLIYLNDLFISMAADVLYFQEVSGAQAFNTGYNAGLSATQAASTTKAIIFSVLTVVEVAAARLILWDDAKALAGFKPGSIGTDRAASMAKTIGGAVFTVMTLGKGTAAVSAARNSAQALRGRDGLPSGGGVGGTARVISSGAAQAGRASTGGGGGQTGRGTNQFGSSLNPPPTRPTSPPTNQ